jgi:hypothetical protein
MATHALATRFLGPLAFAVVCAGCATRTDVDTVPAAPPAAGQEQPASAKAEPPAVVAGSPTIQSDAATPANQWAEPARNVLLPHCGRCHNGALESSLERARAAYDLSETVWYARMTAQRYDAMLRRVQGNDAITSADKTMIERFVRCARDGDCAD